VPDKDNTFYRRNLPHYQPPYSQFFVTFRLADSIPVRIIAQFKNEQKFTMQTVQRDQSDNGTEKRIGASRKNTFARFDALLDGAEAGPTWLGDDRIAQVVKNAIHFRDGKTFSLLAYCIMPNHVHLVVDMDGFPYTPKKTRDGVSRYIITDAIGSLKKLTAGKANIILHRSGAFWQHESYDHVVRNGKELRRIINYVLNNPVKARLVSNAKDWKWSYTKFSP
jgi:REP element-mobilizing transposase RayT